jgi:hypothetical protein
MLTNQQIFDRVATHLLRQGKRSMDSRGDCLYRSPEGLSCAVGCLIPDEAYLPTFEGLTVRATRSNRASPEDRRVEAFLKALEGSGINLESSLLVLGRLQYIHDNVTPKYWRTTLEGVAQEFGLTLPEMPGTK